MVGKGDLWVIYNPVEKGFLSDIPFTKWCSKLVEAKLFQQDVGQAVLRNLQDSHPGCGLLKAKISL